MYMKKWMSCIGLMFVMMHSRAQIIEMDLLKKHIQFLSHDRLKGRGTGTKGERTAAAYIADYFKTYQLIPKGTDSYFQMFYFSQPSSHRNPHQEYDSSLVSSKKNSCQGTNVIGWLDNKSITTIVIGAHYDHIGEGEHGGGYPKNKGQIHNGADDNASGVAGLLELARYFSQNGIQEKNNFLFIAFSGEELGLLGSHFFCKNPTIDLSTIDIMINMDMIGRLDSINQKLVIYGVGTSPSLVDLIATTSTVLQIKTDSAGIGPSDHTSFYLKKIPVLHFFTGQHLDYHQPTDDEEKINYKGEKDVLQYIVNLIEKIDQKPKLVFSSTAMKDTGSRKFKVTLGIMPDYTFDGTGVRVDAVTDGKPASKAGVKRDDVIVKVGNVLIATIQDYMRALALFEKGDHSKIRVNRNNQIIELDIVF